MTRFHRTRATLLSVVAMAVLLGSLAAPSTALAAQVSNVGKKVAEPWFDNSVPWDGQWGAFNQDTSEAASGACLLTANQINQTKSVIDALQDDFRNIDNRGWPADKKAKVFRSSIDERIKTGNPADELENSAIIKKGDGAAGVDPPAGKPRTSGRWELGDNNTRRLFPKGRQVKPATFPEFFRVLTANKKVSGCNFGNKSLKSLLTLITPNFTDIFKEPAGFIARIFMFLPCLIAYGIWEVVGEIALQATFTTPHSERGDTIVDTIAAERKISKGIQGKCSNKGCSYAETRVVCKNVRTPTGSASVPSARGTKTLQKGENTAQLGFKCSNALSVKKQQSNVWIAIAKAFRNILSALYGVIVIGIALMYLFRRDPSAAYDVKVVLPKVLVAVVLSAAAPYIIGLCITSANWFVQGILSGTAGTIPNEVTAAILNVKDMSGTLGGNGFFTSIPGQLAEVIFPVIILCVVAFVTLALLVVAVLKQLALIALIVATPFACLSFVFIKWQGMFSMWVRGLVAITAIPIIQALLMRTGIGMAEMIGRIEGIAAILAATILAATFYGLLKVVIAFRTYVTGNKQSSMLNKAKQVAIGAGVTAATGGAGTVASLALSSAQGAASGGGKLGRAGFKAADNQMSGKLSSGTGAAGGALRGVGSFASNAAQTAGDAGKRAANSKAGRVVGQGAKSIASGTGKAIDVGKEGAAYGKYAEGKVVQHDKSARHRTSIIPKSGDGILAPATASYGRDRVKNGEGSIGDMLRQQQEEKDEARKQEQKKENRPSTSPLGKFKQARNPQAAASPEASEKSAAPSAPAAPVWPVGATSSSGSATGSSTGSARASEPRNSGEHQRSGGGGGTSPPSSAPPSPGGERSSGGPRPAESEHGKVMKEGAGERTRGGSPVRGKTGSGQSGSGK